jgi:hypothetical protein
MKRGIAIVHTQNTERESGVSIFISEEMQDKQSQFVSVFNSGTSESVINGRRYVAIEGRKRGSEPQTH